MSLDKAANAERGGQDQASSSGSASTSQSHHSSAAIPVMKTKRNDAIKTIQEITKVDEFTINQAIEACQDSEGKYSLDQVLNILMDEQHSIDQPSMQQHGDRNLMKKSGSGGLPSIAPGRLPDAGNNKSSAGCGSPSGRASEYGSLGFTPNLDLDEDEDDFDAINVNQSNTGSNQQFSNSLLTGSSSDSNFQKSSGNSLSELSLLREEGKPAGLKNVGNTCWFNSIIQAFFHLPYLRSLIISFQISEADINQLEENSRNVVYFVLELRKLFTLMLKSKRKSINPNPTLRCLRSCSKYDVELFNQEDVSEFATILVNLIEESFDILDKLQQQKSDVSFPKTPVLEVDHQSGDIILPVQFESLISPVSQMAPTKAKAPVASVESSSIGDAGQLRIKNKKNPIVKLLNGDILINRTKSGEEISNSLIEVFREVNIQMLNARNLHAGLELEWGETSIDKLITPNTSTATNNNSQLARLLQTDTDPLNKSIYQQESWLVQLPPVLFICLNRYKFVKATQTSSKILEPFEFEQHIYLDRYIYSNREAVKSKRRELQLLNADLSKLEAKLKSIKNYEGSSSSSQSNHKYALDDILKCALSFVTTDHSLDEVFNSIIPVASDTADVKDTEKLDVVKDFLKSWIGKLDEKIKELTKNIGDVKAKIENIYDVPEMKKVKYNLHSVCIHEGNAVSGHFWTYIWNTQQLKWYKFNDTEVSESNWDNLYQNAIGGITSSSNQRDAEATTTLPDLPGLSSEQARQASSKTGSQPSAYFLIYVKADDETLYQEKNQIVDQDLIKLIEDDYENLKKQVFNLRLKKLQRDCIETLKKSNCLIEQANLSSQNPITDQNNQTCLEHVKAFKDSIIDCFSRSFDRISSNENLRTPFGAGQAPVITLESSGVQEALSMALEIELNKYTEGEQQVVAKLPDNDLRTIHILTYLSCNQVPRDVRIIALYDLFRIQIFTENNIKLKLVQMLSQIKLNECILTALQKEQAAGSNEVVQTSLYRTYEKWQNDYRDFRSIVAAFINAANFMEYQKYEEAATFFCVACEYNERITNNFTQRMKGMDNEFLLLNRRKCLKMWSQSVIRKFSRSSQASHLEMVSSAVASDSQQQQPLSQQDMTALIELMMSKFLPCFFRLGNANSTPEDKAMIDEIRQDWLSVLDSNLPELQVFHDFMTKLFEDQIVNHFHSLNVNKTMLTSRYKEAVQLLKRIR